MREEIIGHQGSDNGRLELLHCTILGVMKQARTWRTVEIAWDALLHVDLLWKRMYAVSENQESEGTTP